MTVEKMTVPGQYCSGSDVVAEASAMGKSERWEEVVRQISSTESGDTRREQVNTQVVT